MMMGVIPELDVEVVVATDHYDLDPMPFGIDVLSESDADECAKKVADHLAGSLKGRSHPLSPDDQQAESSLVPDHLGRG